ncbi:SDR family NAD(P)-dependent oxidoreductase [Candidatus Woesebacteria bacterium]|nr:SDR family NAD(P)-dependent oxidoreductase [Candidatus Woesebacteria bacterium]MCD8546346.1 SDR family NAD(P)-dependent oxidoreductase [Candidatus Woesebacteria bacterium]
MSTKTTPTRVVITGASSGNGRALAHEFAKQGAQITLAARRNEELQEVIGEVSDRGGEAIAVPLDVTDRNKMHHLAQEAEKQWGGFDVWINNAAVIVYGNFMDIPTESFQRVIEVNLMGYVYGCQAALQHFQGQKRGTLINISSVIGAVPMPHASPYVTSKFAIRGLTQSLRLEYQNSPIHICLVLPATFDTPIYQRAANYSGQKIQPVRPIYHPSQLAKTVVRLVDEPRNEVTVGMMGKVSVAAHRLFPQLTEYIFSRYADHMQLLDSPAEHTDGNLFTPQTDTYDILGGWKEWDDHA